MAIDQRRLAAARLAASEAQPYLAVALHALVAIERQGPGTMSVDHRWRLYVDGAALDSWTVAEAATVLLHEVGHLVRDHHDRARSAHVTEREKVAWNWAADAEINDDLRDDGREFPGSPVFPESFDAPPGHAAEYYFHLLRRGEVDLPGGHAPCGGPLFTDPDDDRRDEWAAAHGLPVGLTRDEGDLVRDQVALAVLAHGRLAGTHAGAWHRWATARMERAVPWRQLLRSAVRAGIGNAAGMVDYTYARPSRRRMPGVILPSLRRPVTPVAVVIDTSGSVDDDQLAVAWGEVHTCLDALGIRRDLLSVYAVDTEAHELRPPYRLEADLGGGGGTDLGVGIDAAMARTPRPGLVVVLTDGWTPWPASPPACRVVVGLFEGTADPSTVPPWATVVTIPAEAAAE